MKIIEEKIMKSEKYRKKPYEIPKFMRDDFIFSENIKAKYLIPKKTLIKKAFRNLVDQYKSYLKGETKESLRYRNYFIYSYEEIKDRSIFRWEFIYYVHQNSFNRNYFTHEKNHFVLTEAFDLKNRLGLLNERKKFSGMGGWNYKPTYDSFINQYGPVNINNMGSIWTGKRELAPSFQDIKINDFFSLSLKEFGKGIAKYDYSESWIDYTKIQQMLEKEPDITEILFKMGFNKLVHRNITKEKVIFLRKNKKTINRDIKKEDLDLLYGLEKGGYNLKLLERIRQEISGNSFTTYDNKKNKFDSNKYNLEKIKEIGFIPNSYTTKGERKSYSTTKIKVLIRVINLLDNGVSWGELNHFAGCCFGLKLNVTDEIFKGKKERDIIVTEFKNQFDIIKKEIKRKETKEEKERVTRIKKEKEERKKQLLTMDEILEKYKLLEINNFILRPLKSFKEFQEAAKTFGERCCLVRNEFHLKAAKEEVVIFVARHKKTKEEEGELVSLSIKGKKEKALSIDQIHGYNNRNTTYYEQIKQIVSELKYEDIIKERN